MTQEVNFHIGTAEEMGKRFIDAWHRHERGEDVNENNITFLNVEDMISALSSRRLSLLRYVHSHSVPNIKYLAKELGRDYKSVWNDVSTLSKTGLLERDEQGIRAPYDSVHAKVSLLA